MVTVLRPTSLDLPPAAWAILGSALCWALLSISNRRLAGIEPAPVLAFYTIPVSALLAALLTAGEWRNPEALDWVLFAVAGFCGATSSVRTTLVELDASRIVFASDYPQEIRKAEAVRDFVDGIRDLDGGEAILSGNVGLLLPR